MGGLDPVLSLLSSNRKNIAKEAATIIGQMASNNIKAQKNLHDKGAIKLLIEGLLKVELRPPMLYALGSIIRNYKDGTQAAFKQGAHVLIYDFLRDGGSTLRLKKKAVNVLGDSGRFSHMWGEWLSMSLNGDGGKVFSCLLSNENADEELHEKDSHISHHRLLTITLNPHHHLEA